MSLVDIGKEVFKATPKEWRPAIVMSVVAAAIVYGYFAKIAVPVSDAHAMGVDNTKAIQQLDRKSEQRHQQDQSRFNTIEGNQLRQNQKMDDMSDQLKVILQVMITGQKPSSPPRHR